MTAQLTSTTVIYFLPLLTMETPDSFCGGSSDKYAIAITMVTVTDRRMKKLFTIILNVYHCSGKVGDTCPLLTTYRSTIYVLLVVKGCGSSVHKQVSHQNSVYVTRTLGFSKPTIF